MEPSEVVLSLADTSSFLNRLALLRNESPRTRGLRQLTQDEIALLQRQHCGAEDWNKVWVAPRFNPHKAMGCYFMGDVWLGEFEGQVELEPGVFIGAGVYNCDLKNVSVGDNAFVASNILIANCHIGDRAVVQGCGTIACAGATTFGNGVVVSLGVEGGLRNTPLYAEISVEVAAVAARGCGSREARARYTAAVATYTAKAKSERMIIESGARVRNVPKVLNCYIGPGAIVDAAAWLENSTVLSLAEPGDDGIDHRTRVTSGAILKNSMVQSGSRIESHAYSENSVFCEHSYADRHAKANFSLIGPNSGVSAGECGNSLVGPFVGFHHQSLLLSCYWPAGKGLVAYGANVGSNHTGRMADQEFWAGEGMLLGMGVNIKYPADFSHAPYTIAASGITTLPQRCEMPFSLLTMRAESIEGISPAYNEIVPGWVLSDNIYAVLRNERKYAIRDRTRDKRTPFEVFRPEIVEMMIAARKALQSVNPSKTSFIIEGHEGRKNAVYTDRDLPQIGKNFMKENARVEGIRAFTFYIRYYALKGLLFAMQMAERMNISPADVLEPSWPADERFSHERSVLCNELPGLGLRALLQELSKAQEKVLQDTLLAKQKDDFRGVRIIPDYAEIHPRAEDDLFVAMTRRETAEMQARIAAFLAIIP